MKRFYKTATIAPEGNTFAVQLDGRPVKTPQGAQLVLPTPALADAVAEEWRQQGDTIQPAAMHLTKSANTAIDGVAPRRSEVIEELLKYGSGDLLCYRADDAKLAARQAAAWDPVLDWLADRYGARLAVTQGITHIAQPGDAVLALGRALAPLNDYIVTGLHVATALTGSLTLALALEDAHLDAATAFDKAHLDERYQAERWGRDAEADARLDLHAYELEMAAKFMSLART
ncbi:MAG TPA: ATP12 family protein [Rhizomicrobium sp.]|jgi:chaperone required for assembly of F1-ATPase|nr:ATP12 family protein [Rhizomicrobium sp.]